MEETTEKSKAIEVAFQMKYHPFSKLLITRGHGKLVFPDEITHTNANVQIFKNSFLTTAHITPNGTIQLK